MKGSAQLADNHEVLTMSPETSTPMNQSLRSSVRDSLQGYARQRMGPDIRGRVEQLKETLAKLSQNPCTTFQT